MPINRNIITSRAGDNDDAAQVFLANASVPLPILETSPFNFEVPVYSTNGASFSYYTQDINAISTNLNNTKALIFNFSANTDSLTGVTEMIHDVYRLKYELFNDVVTNTGTTLFEDAVSAITVPLVTLVESVSGTSFVANSAHTLNFPVRIKPVGEFAQDMMMDKSQYFVDSKFFFPKALDVTLGEIEVHSGDSVATLFALQTGDTEYLTSSGRPHQITGGTFSGTTINGAFFTYFTPPHKPDIKVIDDQPSVIGNMATFSPIFSFKNVDDGDYYRLQVDYNTGDTAFTGTTTIFKIQKQIGDAEFIRTFATPLTPNADFIYRVGNTKEIINIFGIKQNVTVWGEYALARTANDGQFTLSGTAYKNVIGGTTLAGVTVTLTILSSISNIDLGVDSTQNPDIFSEITSPLGGAAGSTITVGPTGPNGQYSFGRINGGTYQVTAQNPTLGPSPQTVTITLSSDTNLDFIFGILWGSTTVTFFDPETFL